MVKGFWESIKKPLIGLSPMDGVTDVAFRFITAKYGHPSVIFTEFTSAEGICRGVLKRLTDLKYEEIERPVVAQIFGADPDSFYKVALIVAALGFDGLDINMGCPDRSVTAKQGSGAALILKPVLAKEIIRAAKSGMADWARGKELSDVGLPSRIVDHIRFISSPPRQNLSRACLRRQERQEIPVSVKTRLGFDKVVIEDWTASLLEARPAAISIHGRTLKQMYSGAADWEAIRRAAVIAEGSGVLIIGNGDVGSYADGLRKIEKYGVDGVLIGRASFGNPWIFRSDYRPDTAERLSVMLEHARYFSENLAGKPFVSFRKHLGWYCSHFEGAALLRSKLMTCRDSDEVREAVDKFLGETGRF